MLGLSNKGIARRLTLARGTVKTHVKAILRKLNATNRTGAVAIAQRRGILREETECSNLEVAAVNMSERGWGMTEARVGARLGERRTERLFGGSEANNRRSVD
jgi:hypothetical protein